ncbi:MAG: glycosyltransferase family 2 protein [Bacteroidaceae bacterium]
MELSVIIPVYNMRDTLDRCLRSVLSQQVDDMEVILVDDGSTDDSLALMERWAQEHPMMRVCRKENGGLSDARNEGLRLAGGRYVAFVDADDEVAQGTYAALMDILRQDQDTDILEFPVLVHAGHTSQHHLLLPDKYWPSARSYWLRTEAWEHTYAWNKVYRRNLFDEIRFPVGRVFEDMWTIPQMLAQGVNVRTTSRGLYIYHWNQCGITVGADGQALYQLLEAQMRAARLMRTHMLSAHGWRLYRSMLYRQLDVYRLTGDILLKWPFVKLICLLHDSCR